MGSIIPCLALRGVATGIAQSPSLKVKVLLCELTFFLWGSAVITNGSSERP